MRLDLLGREVAERAFGLDRAELVARAFLDDVGDDEVTAVGRQFGERGDDPEVGIALGQIEGAQLLLVGREPVGIVAVVRLEEAEDAAGLPRDTSPCAAGRRRIASLPMMLIAADLGLVALVDSRRPGRRGSARAWTILGSTRAAKRPWRLYSSMIRSTSARTFERVKISRGASLISGRILSSLMRLLPSRTMRLMTGFSRTVMTILPVSAPVITTSENSSVA